MRKTASLPLLTNTYSASIGRIVTHYYSKNKKKVQCCAFFALFKNGHGNPFFSVQAAKMLVLKCFLVLFFIGLFRIENFLRRKLEPFVGVLF